ncbi:DUF1501 domain-containing protein [bacterium]|nr:DUF1501 domain-containing protein [bacterium]
MDRRDFLQTGMSLSATFALSKLIAPFVASAQSASEDFPVLRRLVWIHMQGGWDILETVDPKTQSTSKLDMVYDYSLAQPLAGASEDIRLGRWWPNTARLGSDLILVRGLAMGTTSHDAGSVYADTGVLSNSGNVNAASIPTIIASQSGATIPLIQFNGGDTPRLDRGLLKPVSVVRAGDLNLYQGLFPANTQDNTASQRVLEYSRRSLLRYQNSAGANDRATAVEAARSKIQVQIDAGVGSQLSLTDSDKAAYVSALGKDASSRMDNAVSSFALAYKLIKNNLVSCINMGVGGFDTHTNQDRNLMPILTSFDALFATFLSQLKSAGLLDKTLVVLYSDFARTPKVNNSAGRDHWPVGGALIAGGGLLGGRAVGATDENLLARNVDAKTGAPSASGIQLSPIHVGGSLIELTLGASYLSKRPYLESIPALTRLKS